MEGVVGMATLEATVAAHGARLDSLEAYQDKQNGHLERIDEKIDSINKWLIGLLGSTIVSLILLIANLVVMRGGK